MCNLNPKTLAVLFFPISSSPFHFQPLGNQEYQDSQTRSRSHIRFSDCRTSPLPALSSSLSAAQPMGHRGPADLSKLRHVPPPLVTEVLQSRSHALCALEIFRRMRAEFGIKSRVFLFNRLFEALMRRGHVDQALSVYNNEFREDGLEEESSAHRSVCRLLLPLQWRGWLRGVDHRGTSNQN